MSERSIFGVALRVLGIWFVYRAAENGMWVLLRLAHVTLENETMSPDAHLTQDVIWTGFYLVLALVLLAGAEGIIGLVYGPKIAPPAP